MLNVHPLGCRIEGRPCTECGYGLGLMIGRMEGVGRRAIGHSGGGPFSVYGIYQFPDLEQSVTVAAFTEGINAGDAKLETVNTAREIATDTRSFNPMGLRS